MNKEIAELLNITESEASKVIDFVDENYDLDYSEVSQKKFESTFKRAYKEMVAA